MIPNAHRILNHGSEYNLYKKLKLISNHQMQYQQIMHCTIFECLILLCLDNIQPKQSTKSKIISFYFPNTCFHLNVSADAIQTIEDLLEKNLQNISSTPPLFPHHKTSSSSSLSLQISSLPPTEIFS